jgi:hypothetical protein
MIGSRGIRDNESWQKERGDEAVLRAEADEAHRSCDVISQRRKTVGSGHQKSSRKLTSLKGQGFRHLMPRTVTLAGTGCCCCLLLTAVSS